MTDEGLRITHYERVYTRGPRDTEYKANCTEYKYNLFPDLWPLHFDLCPLVTTF